MTKEEKTKKILTLLSASTMSTKEKIMWTIMLDKGIEEDSLDRLLASLEKEVHDITDLYLSARKS